MHDPAVQSKIHPGYLGVTDITETDKNLILGNSFFFFPSVIILTHLKSVNSIYMYSS